MVVDIVPRSHSGDHETNTGDGGGDRPKDMEIIVEFETVRMQRRRGLDVLNLVETVLHLV